MRIKLAVVLALGVIAVGIPAALSIGVSAQESGPTVVAEGLLSPRGLKMGPDGMLYVAEAGLGGDTTFTAEDGTEYLNGLTGRISKIDPETGDRETVADDLPSNAGPEGDAVGPADVEFLDGNLYYLQTHGGEAYGFPDQPTGIYRVEDDGDVTLLADIGAFNLDNPIADIASGAQQDIEPGGNPYAMIVRDGAFLVTDGNQNQVMKVTEDGDISRLAEFSGHPVTTGIASNGGPLFVGSLGQFPFTPEDGNVYQVAYPTGDIAEIADGVSSVTDVEFGPGGQLYALSFGAQASSPDAPAPWDFNSGRILRVEPDGTLSTVFTGLNLTTAIIFDGDTAYISNNGITIPDVFDGQIVKVEGVSALPVIPATPPTPTPAAPAPVPTPTVPGGTITAPDTGSGPVGGSADSSLYGLIALALAGSMVAGFGIAVKRS